MIGFQCAPNHQQVAAGAASSSQVQPVELDRDRSTSPSTSESPSPVPDEQPASSVRQPSLKRDQQHISGPLSGHVDLLNQTGQQAKRPASATTMVTSSQMLQSADSSPGYHSAGSSPSSSAASPISSSSTSSAATGLSSLNSSTAPASNCSAQSLVSTPTGSNGNSNKDTATIKVAATHSLGSSSNGLLDYFPDLQQDGVGLTWFHDANSRVRLNAAIASDKLLVSGDISLAEMSRYPVPIMARPPLGTSDITLENWLQELVHARNQHGLKLTFTSTRTVEPAFRVLARHAEHIRGPLILSADILAPPVPGAKSSGSRNNHQQSTANGQPQPVDAWTFLMLCRTRFPKCVISIGWCGTANSAGSSREVLGSAPSPQSSESMFELDLLDQVVSHPAGLAGLNAAVSSGVGLQHQHQSMGHLQQFNQQLSRLQQQLHPYPQLAALGNHQRNPFQPAGSANGGANSHLYAHLNMSASQHQLNQLVGQHLLSSTGSLASGSGSISSGHSSGSPSPTSPIGHLMSPQQLLAAAVKLEPADQHLFLGDKISVKGAAAAVAALAAASGSLQQLPLNLNINEADQEHSSSLNELAQKIQSAYQQQQQHNLTNTTSQNKSQQLHNRIQPESSNKLSLQHIHKKPALGHNHGQANLLLKTTGSSHSSTTASHTATGYTREMIDKMASLVKEYNLTQPVTFPVQARMLKNSLGELQRLLYQVGSNSTLTVIAQQEDLISVDDLLTIRKAFASHQILFDLPEELANSLRQELDNE